MSEAIVVSDEFMEFYGKEADAIAVAQQAEAATGNVPFEIGTSGVCIVKSVEFGKSKDREIEDPENKALKITKKGMPFVKFVFQVIDHKQYSGEQFPKTWYLWENDTTSRVQVYKRFLDECEKRLGLTREVRESPNFTPKMLGDFFTSGNPLVTIEFRVAENARNTYDGGKEILFNIPKELIPADAGNVPGKTETVCPFKLGDKVTYLDINWEVAGLHEGRVELKSGDDTKLVKTEILIKSQS